MNTIYLDNSATTRIKDEVLEAMMPYLTDSYYNPSARYRNGRDARLAIAHAREQVAELINAEPNEIFFTSGGTESNNWAINMVDNVNIRGYIMTDEGEHPALYNAAKRRRDTVFLPLDRFGFVSPNIARYHARQKEGLGFISVALANNEVGTIQPVKDFAKLAHSHAAYFHTDAVQALGNMKINVKNMGIDLMSMSSHKIYGPKGVGALYIEKSVPKSPFIFGGGQEAGYRSGTENVAGIVGFGKACEIANKKLFNHREKVRRLRKRFIDRIQFEIPNVFLVGATDMTKRLPGHASMAFEGVEAESLLMMLETDGICCSVGSACSSNSLHPSRVIAAMGVQKELQHSIVRFTFGDYNNASQVNQVVDKLKIYVDQLRNLKE